MPRKQLTALFMCNLTGLTVGVALIGLLPVYATRLGADSALTGYYMALAFLAFSVGGVASGWLSDRFQRRKAFLVVSGTIAAPLTWLMSQAVGIGQLAVLTTAMWFIAGSGVSMIGILAGLSADEAQRGRVYGILGLGGSLGGVIGGIGSGPIVDRWGFPALFTICALVGILQPLAGLFLEDPARERVQHDATATAGHHSIFGRAFVLLILASVMGQLAGSSATLARPLIMDKLHFDATAISSTVAIGSAISSPLPFLVGWLSDRFGRLRLLALIYLVSAVGMVMLAASASLWHFWVAAALLSAVAASMTVGSALVTDSVPRESLGTALSLFGVTPSLAFVLGMAGTGESIRALGMSATLLIAAILPLVAILLLLPLRRPAPAPKAGRD